MSMLAGKYLAFQLGTEEYAIDVAQVREIMGLQEITTVPQTPALIRGVINLRGRVIPVVDLRVKFGLSSAELTPSTCLVIIQMSGETRGALVGLLVDTVSEVLTLAPTDIERPPDFGSGVETPYLLGLARVKGRFKILLDIQEVLTAQELQALPTLAA